MDQLNLFKGAAHVWILPSIAQIAVAAYADNPSIDPATAAGHGVYRWAERQSFGEESWSVQPSDHRTVTW